MTVPPGGRLPRTPGRTSPLAFCAEEVARLEAEGLGRRIRTLGSGPGPTVELDGRQVICLASNDYLGLAAHPEVTGAAAEAVARYGAGSGAARLVTGALPVHEELEADLARFKGCESALLFSSGYLANIGTVAALVGPGDAVFSDALNHASIVDGARLSRADVVVFAHADAGDCEARLAAWRAGHAGGRALVVTDSVFSMDGDLAPLPDLVAACERHGAALMVDEAHATGVVGPQGRGAVAHFGLVGRVGVVMGTLSKALGGAGGFVAGEAALTAYLRHRARSFVFDTAMPPSVAAAAAAALAVLRREPQRPLRVRALAARLAEGLSSALAPSIWAVPAATPSAILPVVVGEAGPALAASAALLEAGVLVVAIRPPSVPPGTSRLRVTVTAGHTEAHIDATIDAFRAVADRAGHSGLSGLSGP